MRDGIGVATPWVLTTRQGRRAAPLIGDAGGNAESLQETAPRGTGSCRDSKTLVFRGLK